MTRSTCLVPLLALALTGCLMSTEETDALGADERVPVPSWLASTVLRVQWESVGEPPPDAEHHVSEGREIAFAAHASQTWLGNGEEWFMTGWLEGPEVPASTRLYIGLDVNPHVESFIVVDGSTAWSVGESPEYHEAYELERAPLAFGLSEEDAFASTSYVRWLKACPISFEECLVYGPPEHVDAAEDPLRPLGDVLLVDAAPPMGPSRPDPKQEEIALLDAPGVRARHGIFENEDGEWRDIVQITFAHPRGDVHAFDIYSWDAEGLSAGVVPMGTRTLVWARLPWEVTTGVSIHDTATGERLAEPIVRRLDPYFELECSHGWSDQRLIPTVQANGGIGLALFTGMRDGLLFEDGAREGRPVQITHGVESWEELEEDREIAAPPVLMHGADVIEGASPNA
jgi:hypothetical protein